MHKIYIFLVFFFAANVGFSPSLFAQADKSYNCPITLKVEQRLDDIVLGHGGEKPRTYSLILKPVNEISDNSECESYVGTNKFRMNNVQQHDQAFQSLDAGDVVTGTLNFHLPSPYGKTLNENYHNGFRLLTVTKAGESDISEDYSDKYTYFRHMGAY